VEFLQIYWTKECAQFIDEKGAEGLKEFEAKCTEQLNDIVNLVRGELTKLERATLGALVTVDVHARDVCGVMKEAGVNATTDFKVHV
jgi:dynein heavy chain